MSSLGVTGTVQAAGSASSSTRAPSSDHRADPGFGPAERKAAISTAKNRAGATARSLRLGVKQQLIVRNVSRDVDGVEHVHYARTYDGLPVIGGDLIVHETPAGRVRTVDWASRSPIRIASTTPTVSADRARGSHDRTVVFAAHHAPVLAWESTVTGTAEDGTPIRDLVYTDARTGRQLAVHPTIQNDTGTGS